MSREAGKELSALFRTVPGAQFRGSESVVVHGIVLDSRSVKSGDLFFCIPGLISDGHDFADMAEEQGAAALVVERWLNNNIPQVKVDSCRRAIARASDAFYGSPSEALTVIGVTGTNGKTTVTHFLESILQASGQRTGLLGTITGRISGEAFPIGYTTPEAPDLNRMMREMVKRGVETLAMEVSSHAIDLHRVDACSFDVLVFTNLSGEHLDYHGDMEQYYAAKSRLFLLSPKNTKAVVNIDDEYGRRLAAAVGPDALISYGLSENADYWAHNVTSEGTAGTTFSLITPEYEVDVSLQLPGRFNVYNALAAVAAAQAVGLPIDAIRTGAQTLAKVPGRFEAIHAGQDFSVIVDYAHSPDSLEKLLGSAREISSGRVIIAFGCGGNRDRAKRPVMGKIAEAGSDLLFITSDNPRWEEPSVIIQEIVAGLKDSSNANIIPERRGAIEAAIAEARSGDVVVIAGKGHEAEQIVGAKRLPFDDRAVARQAISAIINSPNYSRAGQ